MIREMIEHRSDADHDMREQVERLLDGLDASSFLDWVKEDREYSYYYFDVQASGVCAKPREAAALILEAIAKEAK